MKASSSTCVRWVDHCPSLVLVNNITNPIYIFLIFLLDMSDEVSIKLFTVLLAHTLVHC